MNCRSAEPLVLAERDGVLTPAQHAELAQHLATCAGCRQFRAELAAALETVRAEAHAVPLPDIDAEWRAVQAKINDRAASDPAAASLAKKRRLAPVVWISAPLAAAAAVALALFVQRPVPMPAATSEGVIAARADFVEVADPKATPIVYTDKESGWLVVWAESPDTARASS
jgi:hypothetical protein